MKYLLLLILLMPTLESKILLANPLESKTIDNEWSSLKNGDEIGRYFRRDNLIYVHLNAMISQELKNADPSSFLVNKRYSDFSKDKTDIWFISQKLRADRDSWVIITQYYSKDRSHVYYGSHQLPDSDPKTFKVTREGIAQWGADKNSVYSQWSKLENSDPQTFQFINISFSKDKNNVYYNQNKLDGADPDSFEIIKENVAKDKNSVFAFGKRMPNYIDISSIRVPGDGYIYDKNGQYYLHKGEWVNLKK